MPNIHGDVYLTVDADGQVKSTHQTGPFGEQLPNQTSPQNTADGTTWNYVGQHQKLTDTDTSPISGGIIQMGARVYIPTLGRFLQVDPVEGGGDNTYAYVNDPVNSNDRDGKNKVQSQNRKVDKILMLYKKSVSFKMTYDSEVDAAYIYIYI